MKNSLLILLASAVHLLAQGPLTPPGAPAPTMKTLAQIEARIPIPKTEGIPVNGAFYVISQPGSYYLTGDVTVSSGVAISINSDNVTLDLNGFTVSSTQAASASGIGIAIGTSSHVSIENGAVRGGTVVPQNGLPTEAGFNDGISATTGTHITISHVSVSGVGSRGIFFSGSGLVEACSVTHCGTDGILAPIVSNSSAEKCYSRGIRAFSSAINSKGQSYQGNGLACDSNATNCTGASTSGIGLKALNATNCYGTTSFNTGLSCDGNATNCTGTSISGIGLSALNATNCFGRSDNNTGLSCLSNGNANSCVGTSRDAVGLVCENAIGSTGTSTGGIGLQCFGNATNCSAASTSSTGLFCSGNATNCTGKSTAPAAGAIGINVAGTASYCQGKRDGGTAILAAIAIACTTQGGVVVAPQKFLGTP